MAENESGQDKTEEATPRREEKAREDGQILRSRELTTMIIVLGGSLMLYSSSAEILADISGIMSSFFELEREVIYSKEAPLQSVLFIANSLVEVLFSFLIFLLVLSLLSPVLLGGWSFSLKTLLPNLSKMSPLKGLKRMFSSNSLMELSKALVKFLIVGFIAVLLLNAQIGELMSLGFLPVKEGIISGLTLLLSSFVYVACGLIVLALIDVPYQIWSHSQKLKMSKQEVKDESKDTDGKPEVKRRQREIQNKIARQRMMQEVPKADVIVTNPTHFSVAIRYDTQNGFAPIVTAKGSDEIALKIRELGQAHSVPLLELPPLARALYYSTELNQEVPTGLYVAVAQVLAYVYQLKLYSQGNGRRPTPLKEDLPIPDEYQY